MARHFDCTRALLEDRHNDQWSNTSMCYEIMDQMAQDWDRALQLDRDWDAHDDDGGPIE